MSEKIRDEFEEWFSEYSLPCEGDWFEMDSCGDYYYPSTHDAWMGWKASRAALVVELPPEREERFIDSYQEGWNDAIDSCRVRVESVGVTCKWPRHKS